MQNGAMPLPCFLIIGAQKSGTTWLATGLRQHPEIYIPDDEIHFFDKDYNYRRGISWYRQFFEASLEGQIVGEKTPDYFWTNREGAEGHLPGVHANIYSVLPDAKLILVLRNPVDRAISAVMHLYRSGRISPIHGIDELLVGAKHVLVEEYGIIDYGRYHRHIEAFLSYFDREQLLILIFEEDVVEDPEQGLRKAASFLDVDDSFQFEGMNEPVYSSDTSRLGLYLRYYLPISRPFVKAAEKFIKGRHHSLQPAERTVEILYDLYREENEKLYRFLGRRIPAWSEEGSPARSQKLNMCAGH